MEDALDWFGLGAIDEQGRKYVWVCVTLNAKYSQFQSMGMLSRV